MALAEGALSRADKTSEAATLYADLQLTTVGLAKEIERVRKELEATSIYKVYADSEEVPVYTLQGRFVKKVRLADEDAFRGMPEGYLYRGRQRRCISRKNNQFKTIIYETTTFKEMEMAVCLVSVLGDGDTATGLRYERRRLSRLHLISRQGLSSSRSLFMTMTVRMKGCVIVEIPKSELKLGMVVIKRLCICIRFPVMVIRRVMLHGIG